MDHSLTELRALQTLLGRSADRLHLLPMTAATRWRAELAADQAQLAAVMPAAQVAQAGLGIAWIPWAIGGGVAVSAFAGQWVRGKIDAWLSRSDYLDCLEQQLDAGATPAEAAANCGGQNSQLSSALVWGGAMLAATAVVVVLAVRKG